MSEYASLYSQAKIKLANLSPEVKRYLIIGVLVYLLELLVILAAQQAGMNSVAAVGLSFWLGLLLSFGLQKVVTFGDKRLHHRVVLVQLLAFSALVLFNFVFTLLFTAIFDSVIPAVLCRTIALGITTIWNFYLYKTRIFKIVDTSKKKNATTRRKQFAKQYKRWRTQRLLKRVERWSQEPLVAAGYLALSIVVLLASTVLWGWLGAQLQHNNADQLVNAYLFQSGATWHGAALPDQHSFFIKWPLFYLVALFNYSSGSFIALTIFSALLTVGLFVFLLSRIERRPWALGSMCLALSSILLMVPAQPYAGGLLPVNMAMLTTRNLEYVVFVVSIYLIVRAARVRSVRFWSAVGLLLVLIASDKLFLSVSIGGALLALVAYSLRKRWVLVSLSSRWLVGGVVAGVLGILLLTVIQKLGIVHIVSQSVAGPYSVVHDAKSMGLGIIYGISGVLTNFGANPAYDALALRQIPHSFTHNLFSAGGFAYVLNFLMLLFAVVLAARLLLGSLNMTRLPRALSDNASGRLALLLLWSTLAVGGLFVLSNHYYAADARYLTLSLFALFITVAAWSRNKKKLPHELLVFGVVALVAVGCASASAIHTHSKQSKAFAGINQRNEAITQALRVHKVDVLVGDYWRVIPAKADLHPDQTVLPLQDCTEPRSTLISREWQPDLRQHSFAYLLTLDGSLTDYPDCDLQQISLKYGLPNSSTLIAGSLSHPDELLLFYDHGSRSTSSQFITKTQAEATIVPVGLNQLPQATCPTGRTIMNIVAHQDDDLLFMSPDLMHDIRSGNCVRTIYLTAGDAGGSSQYWLGREQGSLAAYSEMLGGKPAWTQRIVQLPSGQFVTIASPRGNDSVSLIFVRLPDGNLHGDGFGVSHYESLAALEAGRLRQMHSVDHQSVYTAKQLTDGIKALLDTYNPAEVRTQSNYPGIDFPDHSDHRATGRFATRAFRQYEIDQYGDTAAPSLAYYLGYSGREQDPNVDGADLLDKQAAFTAYGAFDGGVCHTLAQCQETATYGSYLVRQYQNPE